MYQQYTALKVRFGLSPQEARPWLSILRKEYLVFLQDHAAEEEMLVDVAYWESPAGH